MEELKSAVEDHMEQMADLVQRFTAELRSGLQPAYENFIGFFHAIDWKVRLVLIEAALTNLPAYYLYLFEMPKVLVIGSLMRNFLWKGDHLLSGIWPSKRHRVLGIGDLQARNQSVLGTAHHQRPLAFFEAGDDDVYDTPLSTTSAQFEGTLANLLNGVPCDVAANSYHLKEEH